MFDFSLACMPVYLFVRGFSETLSGRLLCSDLLSCNRLNPPPPPPPKKKGWGWGGGGGAHTNNNKKRDITPPPSPTTTTKRNKLQNLELPRRRMVNTGFRVSTWPKALQSQKRASREVHSALQTTRARPVAAGFPPDVVLISDCSTPVEGRGVAGCRPAADLP